MRIAMLAGASAIVFAVTVAVGLKLTPAPLTELDYLVVGTAATLLALVVLFAVLLMTGQKAQDVFFKRRRKAETEAEAPTNPE